MNKELTIINELYYWKEKLNIPYFILNIDDKTHYAAYVSTFNDNIQSLSLNMKYLKKQRPISVLAVLFHELGHVVDRIKNSTVIKTSLESELYAERFTIKQMKKYCTKRDYKEYHNSIIKILKNPKWQRKFPLHYKMFSKLYKI